jgi:hypothetical protein
MRGCVMGDRLALLWQVPLSLALLPYAAWRLLREFFRGPSWGDS